MANHIRLSGTLRLRNARRIATRLGAEVRHRRKTGEIVFIHPGLGFLVHNARRCDASRKLMAYLRKLLALEEGAA